jgi:protein-S-isoprenylcysteine O-methyltransferase Ste14
MSLIPAFEPGILNAWLFMIIYPLQWLIVLLAPKHIFARTDHPADLKQDTKSKVMGRITNIFWIGASLYSIFVPLLVGTAWFYTGLAFFIAGITILVLATLTVAGTAADKPFTGGIYGFSRHPMYLSMILVYLGVSIAAASWLFLIITIITLFLMRFQSKQEEEYCCTKFGDTYTTYMNKTPAWFGIPK